MTYSTQHIFTVMCKNQAYAYDILAGGNAAIQWEDEIFEFEKAMTRSEARKYVEKFYGRIVKRRTDQ